MLKTWNSNEKAGLYLCVFMFLGLLMGAIYFINLSNYNIEYVEYQLEPNDSLINIVQEHNEFVPWGWDAQDFVALAQDKNQIHDVRTIQAGEIILIPVATPEEDSHEVTSTINSKTRGW